MNAADTERIEFDRSVLEPLFMPWEFPNAHRQRVRLSGQFEPPLSLLGRLPSTPEVTPAGRDGLEGHDVRGAGEGRARRNVPRRGVCAVVSRAGQG